MPKSSAVLVVALIVVLGAATGAQTTTRRLFVLPTDPAGKPVSGLTSSDFTLTEDGVARTISAVRPADDPMRIIVMMDTSKVLSGSISEIRNALVNFADRMPAKHELGLVTLGGTPVVRMQPSADRAAFKTLALKITTDGGLILLNAIFEMYDRFLRKSADRWPVIVIVATDGIDGSRGVNPDRFVALAQSMQMTDAVVHVIVLSPTNTGNGEAVLIGRALSQATLGSYDALSALSALPLKLATLSETIAVQYDQTAGQYHARILERFNQPEVRSQAHHRAS